MPATSPLLARARRLCVSLNLSPYPSISSADRAGKSAGHSRVSPTLTTQCRESSASPPVTRYSVFFWLLIFHASPLTVSWWSLSLYMVKAWLRSASSTARNYYFQCKSLSHRIAWRAAACIKYGYFFFSKYAPCCIMAAKKVDSFLIFFFAWPECITQEILIFFLIAQFPLPYLCWVWLRFGLGLRFLPFGLSNYSKNTWSPCPNYTWNHSNSTISACVNIIILRIRIYELIISL